MAGCQGCQHIGKLDCATELRLGLGWVRLGTEVAKELNESLIYESSWSSNLKSRDGSIERRVHKELQPELKPELKLELAEAKNKPSTNNILVCEPEQKQ